MKRIGLALVFGLLLCGCNSTKVAERNSEERHYPAHWWEPVSTNGAPGWEIFPQAGAPGKVVILSKRNELGLLSNFSATPFMFRGKRYASLEGFWQVMKYPESDGDPRALLSGLEWSYTREQRWPG